MMSEPEYPLPVPPSDRYRTIGERGEMLGVVLAKFLACRDCGAGVLDTEAHDRWHDARP